MLNLGNNNGKGDNNTIIIIVSHITLGFQRLMGHIIIIIIQPWLFNDATVAIQPWLFNDATVAIQPMAVQ